MQKDRYRGIKWLLRGEYLIGLNEFNREVALIKMYVEKPIGPDGKKEYDGSGKPVYYDKNGRVIA